MCNDEQEASYRKGEQGDISAVKVHVLESISIFLAVKPCCCCFSDKR